MMKVPPDEKSVVDGLRDRSSVVSTLRSDWKKGYGNAVQMVLIALLPDETPVADEKNEGGQPTTIGKLAADALVELANLDKIVAVVRTIQVLEKGSDRKIAVNNWNELVGMKLYDPGKAAALTQRMIECLLSVLRRDNTGILTTLLVYGMEEWKYSIGCLGLKYRKMLSDVESLIKLLREGESETKGKVIGALKEVTGKSFMFDVSNPAKWEKWLKNNRHQFIEQEE